MVSVMTEEQWQPNPNNPDGSDLSSARTGREPSLGGRDSGEADDGKDHSSTTGDEPSIGGENSDLRRILRYFKLFFNRYKHIGSNAEKGWNYLGSLPPSMQEKVLWPKIQELMTRSATGPTPPLRFGIDPPASQMCLHFMELQRRLPVEELPGLIHKVEALPGLDRYKLQLLNLVSILERLEQAGHAEQPPDRELLAGLSEKVREIADKTERALMTEVLPDLREHLVRGFEGIPQNNPSSVVELLRDLRLHGLLSRQGYERVHHALEEVISEYLLNLISTLDPEEHRRVFTSLGEPRSALESDEWWQWGFFLGEMRRMISLGIIPKSEDLLQGLEEHFREYLWDSVARRTLAAAPSELSLDDVQVSLEKMLHMREMVLPRITLEGSRETRPIFAAGMAEQFCQDIAPVLQQVVTQKLDLLRDDEQLTISHARDEMHKLQRLLSPVRTYGAFDQDFTSQLTRLIQALVNGIAHLSRYCPPPRRYDGDFLRSRLYGESQPYQGDDTLKQHHEQGVIPHWPASYRE